MKEVRTLLLFDVDGVLLKEDGYYRTLAFTCAHFYERYCERVDVMPLSSHRATANSLIDVDALRASFLPPPLLAFLRKRALNSNWDKTYAIILAMSLLTREELSGDTPIRAIIRHLSGIDGQGNEYLRELEKLAQVTDRTLFEEVYEVFQEVHLGSWQDISFLRGGMIQYDETIVDRHVLAGVLQWLEDQGYTLGIGTGRPWLEMKTPFEALDLLRFFQPDRIVTIDAVREEEDAREAPPFSLAKPHPFTYLQGAKGVSPSRVYVIGDSPSDQMAATSAGFHFIGVGDSFIGQDLIIVENVLKLPETLQSMMVGERSV